jgi:glycosyltransferase involved in cell wall biosynthesis
VKTEGRDLRRLCTLVHGPYPVGEPRVARLVAVALEERFSVDVLALQRQGERRRETVEGARVLRLPLTHTQGGGLVYLCLEYLGFTAAASFIVAVRTLRRRYQIVQISNPPDLLMLAAIVPKVLGARVIFDVHDFSSDMFELRFGGRRGSKQIERILMRLEKWAAQFADAVIVPHDRYKRELTERGINPEKIKVVMNSPNETLLPTEPPPQNGFRVVYHGTLTPHYGVHVLIDALPLLIPKIPDLRVEIYGDGDNLGNLIQHADALGVSRYVVFSRRCLPHDEVLEAVAGASVGVIPNRADRHDQRALSAKLLEYVALGIPAVAADLDTIREHFSAQEILYFEPSNARSLASRVLEIAVDPAASVRRAARAQSRYEQYRWPISAREYVAALRD